MYKLAAFYQLLEQYAPMELSLAQIERGGHDNSGIIVQNSQTVSKALFALDLTSASLKRAKSLGCDLIVTHHPAIFYPISKLNIDGENSSLLKAVRQKMSVISMHLNLDFADGGIDYSLAQGLNAKSFKIVDLILNENGYGRECKVERQSLANFVSSVKKNFNSKKIIVYGNKRQEIDSFCSFCGGGAEDACKYVLSGGEADVIVTSDMKHHQILACLEGGKSVVVIPHYVAEEYGFKIYYEKIKEKINNHVEVFYFDDKRLR